LRLEGIADLRETTFLPLTMSTTITDRPDDQRRYREFFDGGRGLWRLEPAEFASAKALFQYSPTLRPFRHALIPRSRSLDMELIGRATADGEAVRTMLAAGLSVVTVPALARAYAGDPCWSAIAAVCVAEDLAAIAAAMLIRSSG
jgi:hypothetical protein